MYFSDHEQEEPCEGRPSRTVLWEGRGEIPLSDPISGNKSRQNANRKFRQNNNMNSEEKFIALITSFKKKIEIPSDAKLPAFVFGIVIFTLVFWDALLTTGRQHISFNILALVAGIIFESARLTDKWSSIIYRVFGSLMASFYITHDNNVLGSIMASYYSYLTHDRIYNSENDFQLWAFMFIFVFSLSSAVFHGAKLNPKLTEGISLIQSIAILYWIVENDFLRSNNFFDKLLVLYGTLLSLYSTYQALTYRHLSENKRFLLSIWSSIIMFLFAIDNIIGVFHLEKIENTSEFIDKLYIGIACFFLGISTIYIVQNCEMLAGFWPTKNTPYSETLKKIKNEHLSRYSDKQVNKRHSILCIIFALSIFVSNFFFQFVECNLAIWIVFVILPFVLKIYDRINVKAELTLTEDRGIE
jgi:hypothetical protein